MRDTNTDISSSDTEEIANAQSDTEEEEADDEAIPKAGPSQTPPNPEAQHQGALQTDVPNPTLMENEAEGEGEHTQLLTTQRLQPDRQEPKFQNLKTRFQKPLSNVGDSKPKIKRFQIRPQIKGQVALINAVLQDKLDKIRAAAAEPDIVKRKKLQKRIVRGDAATQGNSKSSNQLKKMEATLQTNGRKDCPTSQAPSQRIRTEQPSKQNSF